ncbi:MAG: acyl-ACP--UDP-N-acetylglucosamine O-acyltransferase [Bacteroidetes bacterium]|nr:MAG: acyl-ACP--UDP-N-acetylglucosamine O-acyltransferase [Bacteroidota bacterium]TAG87484.1 MAG: acyl-ACP--UDP-N-acetylglucosamine O-acyltransferase [Bacteroidota bacterium]
MNHNSLAYIHPNAKIGKNVTIEPFAVIYDNVEIGEDSWIGAHAVVMSGARIGNNCKIHPHAIISNVPQDLKFGGEETLAIIGDRTIVRECVTINRGTADKFKTEIGKDCLLMAYVHVAHDCMIGDKCILANSVQVAGHVEIGYHAILGGTSAVHQFVKIGAHVMVGGGSLVRKDVPPFITVAREPLTYEGLNLVGLRRRGFSNETIGQLQESYKLLYQSGMNTAEALKVIESDIAFSKERDEIINFVKNAERGITR